MEEFEQMAQAFVDLLAKGDFASAYATFDETMKTAAPEAMVAQTWSQLQAQVGNFVKRTDVKSASREGLHLVLVSCEFEQATLDIKLVYTQEKLLTGFFFENVARRTDS